MMENHSTSRIPVFFRPVHDSGIINSTYFVVSSKKSEKLFLHLPIQAVVQIQKLAVEVFEFVPLLDENVQEKFFTFFEETTKYSKWNR